MLEEIFRTQPTRRMADAARRGRRSRRRRSRTSRRWSPRQQTEALGILQKAPDLDMTLAGLPLEFDGVRPPYRFSAPTLGEHNRSSVRTDTPRKKAAS